MAKRKLNARAADRWGVYVKSQLAYVSTKKLDANKAASRLRLSGRANISIKQVGPNPISGIVPKVGWRAEFKKAAYSAMKAPGVRRKRARTTSKIRQTRQRRGENPRRKAKSSRAMDVFDRHQLKIARDTLKMPDAMVGVMGGPSKVEAREIIKRITAKYKRNPAGPSSRAVAGRIGRAVGARVKSRNPSGTITRSHVGKSFGSLPGARRSDARSFGKVLAIDVGKRYYIRDGIFQMENNEQRDKRLKRNPRSAGVGTRSVMRGGTFRGAVGRKRNSAGFYKVWFSGPAGETAGVVVTTDKYPKGKTSIGTYSRLFPFSESPKMRKFHVSKVYPTFEEAFRHPKGPASSGSGPRKRNAPSILRRRNASRHDLYRQAMDADKVFSANLKRQFGRDAGDRRYDATMKGWDARTRAAAKRFMKITKKWQRETSRARTRSKNPTRATPSNPSSGYVVQVGNTVAWVGKLAADAQKAMRKLMAGGRKGVKGFAAKLPVGIKRGWRSQFKAVSRKRNASFGKGKLGSGSRFKSCVRTMKRRGVASPSGLCASIGRRKYGAKRMARMAKRGRARRSNPILYAAILSTGQQTGPFQTKEKAIEFAKKVVVGNRLVSHVKIRPLSASSQSGYGPTVATIVVSR